MPKPFDATTKRLVELGPLDWVRFLGLPGSSATVLSADLSTVTTEADRVLRVEHEFPYGIHLEFQASRDETLELRGLRYNALAEYSLGIPIHTVLVLLRPDADDPQLTGRRLRTGVTGAPYLEFYYSVVRLWQVPLETILAGGLSTLPLALLSEAPRSALPHVVEQLAARMESANVAGEAARELWSAAYILAGLRFAPSTLTRVFQGVRQMKESSTYQAILREGRTEGRTEGRLAEARALLLRQGTHKFGPPTRGERSRLSAVRSLERLEALAERLLDVQSWEELLTK